MGCDIHLMVEYDITRHGAHGGIPGDEAVARLHPPFSRTSYIRAFSDGTLLIERDYALFEALAGVRADEDASPLIAPRGFPEVATREVINQFFLYVADHPDELDHWRSVSREEADEYVHSGESFYRDHPRKPRGEVSNPEWHTPGWLTSSEALAALGHAKLDLAETPCEFQLTLDLMRGLERCFGEDRARMVFWFDN